MAILDAVEAKTPRGEFLRNLAVAVITALLGAIGAGLLTFWNISASHTQTEDHLVTIDHNIEVVKHDVVGVSDEQAKVRTELGAQHDAVRENGSAIKNVEADEAATHTRIDALEAKFGTIAEALAVIKQVVTDNKESQAGLATELKSHSDDLAAIRERLGAARH